MTRRSRGTIVGTILLLTLTGCSAGPATEPTEDGELRPVKITQSPTFDFAPIWVADELGFFQEQGIQVEFAEAVQSGAGQVAQISSGQVDLIPTSVAPVTLAKAEGVADLQSIVSTAAYAATEADDLTSLIVLADGGITRPADLSGKTVGVFSIGGIAQSMVAETIQSDGGDWTAVDYIQVPSDSAGGLLQSGEIDGAFVLTSAGLQLLDSGEFTSVSGIQSSTSISGASSLSLWSTPDWIAENEDIALSVRAAVEKAVEWAVDDANRGELDEILADNLGIPLESITSLPRANYQSSISRSDVKTIQAHMIEFGLIDSEIDVDSFIWNG